MVKSLIISVFEGVFGLAFRFVFNRPTAEPVRVRSIRRSGLFIMALLLTVPAFLHAQVPDGVYPNTTDGQGRKQGAWKKLDEQGTVVYVGQFRDDQPYGLFTYFDTEGFKMTELDFGNGGNVQHAKMYYIDGKLQAEGKYVNHQKDSVWRFYNSDGLFLSEETWVMGKREGKAVVYHPGTNQAASITYFKNGLEDGPYVEYYLEGQKKMEATYVAGNMEGKAIWYFSDGRINIIGAYQHAVKNGKWTYYNSDGTVKGTETWTNGKLTSQEQLISSDSLYKTIEDPQDPDHNRGATEGGGDGGGN